MQHPLSALLESRPKSAPIARPTASTTTAQPGGQSPSVTALDVPEALEVPLPPSPRATGHELSLGFAILAIQDPPSADGRPGAVSFASNLTPAERRALVENLEWFDRSDERLAKKKKKTQNGK